MSQHSSTTANTDAKCRDRQSTADFLYDALTSINSRILQRGHDIPHPKTTTTTPLASEPHHQAPKDSELTTPHHTHRIVRSAAPFNHIEHALLFPLLLSVNARFVLLYKLVKVVLYLSSLCNHITTPKISREPLSANHGIVSAL